MTEPANNPSNPDPDVPDLDPTDALDESSGESLGQDSNEPVRDVAALISAIEWDSTIVSDGTGGADVIAELVKRLPNKPGVYPCPTRLVMCFTSARRIA